MMNYSAQEVAEALGRALSEWWIAPPGLGFDLEKGMLLPLPHGGNEAELGRSHTDL